MSACGRGEDHHLIIRTPLRGNRTRRSRSRAYDNRPHNARLTHPHKIRQNGTSRGDTSSCMRCPIPKQCGTRRVILGSSSIRPLTDRRTRPPETTLKQTHLSNHTGKYACGVTALFTIAGLTQFGNRFLIDTTSEYTADWDAYDKLWTSTATVNDGSSNGIIYGSTKYEMIGIGFTSYCLTQQSYVQGNSGKYSPTLSDYKTSVANKKHSVFSANILTTDGSKSGHIMAVSG